MDKYLMLDIETTGVKPEEGEILQIAFLEAIPDSNGFYYPGRAFDKTLHFDEPVTDEWILKTHKDLLPKCKLVEYQSPVEIRAEVLAFFNRCFGNEAPMLMGLNASQFDIPWLYTKHILKPGDHHYRVYELGGAYKFAMDVMNYDRKTFFKVVDKYPTIALPQGNKHEALYDCYNQMNTLNAAVKMLRLGL